VAAARASHHLSRGVVRLEGEVNLPSRSQACFFMSPECFLLTMACLMLKEQKHASEANSNMSNMYKKLKAAILTCLAILIIK
jgi:arginine exporter protein ArgO